MFIIVHALKQGTPYNVQCVGNLEPTLKCTEDGGCSLQCALKKNYGITETPTTMMSNNIETTTMVNSKETPTEPIKKKSKF